MKGAILLGSVLIALFLVWGRSVASAQAAPGQPFIRIVSAEMTVAGRGEVVLELAQPDGRPIPDMPVSLNLAGSTRRARTDGSGRATFAIRDALPAGSYDLVANYAGSSRLRLGASTTSAALEVKPAIVRIETVPAIAGLGFSLESQSFEGLPIRGLTGADGTVTFMVGKAGDYLARPDEALDSASTIDVSFARWQDDTYQSEKVFTLQPETRLQAGFAISFLVRHEFVDSNGEKIDQSRVSSVTVTSTLGNRVELSRDATWLVGQRAVRGPNGLEAVDVLYSVESVIIDGSNVVNRSEQRFYPRLETSWSLKVRLFSLTLSAADALLGRPTGSAFTLTYPDGRSEVFEFESGSKIVLEGLARGDYRVQVDSAVVAKTVPVSLTRDQIAQVSVVTGWNIGVFLGTLLTLALGVLALGRSSVWRRVALTAVPVHPRGEADRG